MDEDKKSQLPSKDSHCLREPSFIQKRKQSGHEKELTHVTEYQNHDEVVKYLERPVCSFDSKNWHWYLL